MKVWIYFDGDVTDGFIETVPLSVVKFGKFFIDQYVWDHFIPADMQDCVWDVRSYTWSFAKSLA